MAKTVSAVPLDFIEYPTTKAGNDLELLAEGTPDTADPEVDAELLAGEGSKLAIEVRNRGDDAQVGVRPAKGGKCRAEPPCRPEAPHVRRRCSIGFPPGTAYRGLVQRASGEAARRDDGRNPIGFQVGRTSDRCRQAGGQEVAGTHPMISEVVSYLLEDGADDWVMFPDVAYAIMREQGHEEDAAIRREVLNLLLAAGWFECGDYIPGKGFVAGNLIREECLKRIDSL